MKNKQMDGKRVLITGAAGGIGFETAKVLADMGAQVVVHGRNRQRCDLTVHRIKEATGNGNLDILVADLESLPSIRAAARDFKRRFDRLDVLVNNAGGYFAERGETNQGFERTFALNHLAYFLLTLHLADILKASAPARIVNVSSIAHRFVPLDFDDLQNHKYNSWRAYGRSKLMNLYFTRELARRLKGTGVTANCLHPGTVGTGFGQNSPGIVKWLIRRFKWLMLTPEQGAQTSIFLASSPDVEGVSGKYFAKSREARPRAFREEDEAALRLWTLTEELVELEEEFKLPG